MPKSFNIMQLAILLNSRRFVTLKEIQKTLKITERTAYRYLNTVSEANIPVYFDEELCAYTLTRHDLLKHSEISPREAVIITTALKILSLVAEEKTREEAERIITRVLANQQTLPESVMDALDACGNGDRLCPDCCKMISQVLKQTTSSPHTRLRPIRNGCAKDRSEDDMHD